MNTKNVLIALAIIAVLGLVGFLVWWFKFRKQSFVHKRVKDYIPPVKEDLHNKITQEKNNTAAKPNSSVISKVVYMTYHDIDGIPSYVIENIKKNCKGYRIEIHSDQSCEDFLYEYYGPDAKQLFKEIKVGAHKADFWRYCILYVKGGYYFDVKTNFKKHINEIFKINDMKTWYTVLCTKEHPRCIFNGIIVTSAMNPIIWNALNYFFDYPHTKNYMEYVHQLYEFIQLTCEDTLHVGINPQNNGWTCVLLKESCAYNCIKRGIGSCGHDGRDCQISNASGQEVIQTRYNDFPWPKSNIFDQTKVLLIDPSGNIHRDQRRQKMAVVNSLDWHFECLGVILDMTKDKYEIDFYGVQDPEGYVDYFHSQYDFKNFLLGSSNLDESKYDHIVKLSSNDPYKINDLSKLLTIQHERSDITPPHPATLITLSPLTLGVSSEVKTIVSIFEGDNLPQRREQIIVLGGWVDGPLEKLMKDFKYKIILVRRQPRKGDKKWCNSRNFQCIYSPDTEELINLIKVSKFIYIHKTNRFSGSIALALSFHVPMIMDAEQASFYDFPCLTYVDNVTELAPRLNKISIQEYTETLQELSKYTNEKRSFNRQNVDNIFNYIPNIYSPLQEVMFWSLPNNHFPNTIDHDREVKQDLFEHARKLPMGHCVVDGGAHIGDLTIPVAHALRSVGREDIVVYAIEPDHEKCLMIGKMASINKLNNVRVIQVGLSDIEGFYEQDPVSMNDPERIKLNNTGGISWRPANSKGFHFTTIDKLVAENKIREPIGAIHLDVEGMEIECIKGSMRVIERSSPYLSIEDLSDDHLCRVYLPSHYKFKNRVNNNNVYMSTAILEGESTRHFKPIRHFKFVEIGTSDFDTEIEKASDTDIGLSVEPLKTFLDRLPDKQNCTKVNVAISDQAGTLSMYYVDPKDVHKHDLPHWIVGSNSLGNPHPFVMKELQDKNLENLIRTKPVRVITFGMLMEEQGVAGIDYLKVDTEGHDPSVLKSMIDYCDRNPGIYPQRIQFETNGLAEKKLEDEIIKALEKRGYSVVSSGVDTVMTRPGTDQTDSQDKASKCTLM